MKLLGKLILDLIPVMLGVMIALQLNENKSEKDKLIFKDQILTSIRDEIKTNTNELDDKLPNMESFLQHLITYRDSANVSIGNVIEMNNGLSIPTIEIVSYEILINSPYSAEFDYEIIYKLSMLDRNIAEDVFLKSIIRSLYDESLSTDANVKGRLAGIIQDYITNLRSVQLEMDELSELL